MKIDAIMCGFGNYLVALNTLTPEWQKWMKCFKYPNPNLSIKARKIRCLTECKKSNQCPLMIGYKQSSWYQSYREEVNKNG
jgi:hypothetical protein